MGRLSVPGRIYRWSVVFAGVAMLAGLFLSWTPPAGDPLRLALSIIQAVLFVAALAFVGLHPIQLAPNQKMNVGTALMFGALLTLDPFTAAALSTIGTGIHNALLRRRYDNVLFNMAQHSLTVGSASLAFHVFDPERDFHVGEAHDVVGALAGAAVYFLVSTSVAGIMVAFLQRRRPWPVLTNLWRQSGVQYGALLTLGVVGAAVYEVQPLALALIAPPLALVHRSNEQLAVIRETNQKLEEALQAQRRFVAYASHELRTPLTAIQGNIDLLLSGAQRGVGAQETLTDIAREVNRLARLVADLLTLAQADEGQPLSLAPTDLEALSYDVYRQLRPLAGQVAMRFTLEESRDEGIISFVDPDRYRQLLGNLLDNALKYTPPGGQVEVRVGADGQWAKVEVADTGIGIPQEDQDRIFERFYRVDKDRARATGGAGLGLAIARWIAEAHGGRITVASEPGRGSTFTIWLPLRAEQAAA